MEIDIIGAGIGGLTTAIALKKKRIDVRLFEQAEEIKSVGAGIILANNAMQIYEKLGIREEIEKNGNIISSINLTDQKLNKISMVDLKYFEKKHNVKNIAIHRGKLQEILINKFGSDNLNLNCELIKINQKDSQYISKFKNGKSITSNILLGADGLNSKVRGFIFSSNKIRNAFQICWRGITNYELSNKYKDELNEAWDKNGRFGFVQIAPNKVYWYALKSFKQSKDEHSVKNLNKYFENFSNIIQDIIKETPKEDIHTAIISDLKPIKKWYKENICLIGDAAHATTPNMGQGACQAIEDAYVLSECLEKFDLKKAFEKYQRKRIHKAHNVVKQSWQIGKISHLENSAAILIRNNLMKMMPKMISQKQSEKLFQLSNI